MTLLPSRAAQAADGWYVGVNIGSALHEIRSIGGDGLSLDVDMAPGFLIGGAAGFRKKALRLEGEMIFRGNDTQKVTGRQGNTQLPQNEVGYDSRGTVDSIAFMSNTYLHMPVPFALDPYLGLGIGMAQVRFNSIKAGGREVLAGSDWGVAGQIIAGAGLSFLEPVFGPAVSVGAEYRFFYVEESKFVHANRTINYEYQTHSFLLSTRVSF